MTDQDHVHTIVGDALRAAGSSDASADPHRYAAAIAAGHRRRRRVLAMLGTGTVGLVVVASGIALSGSGTEAPRIQSDTDVVVDPSPDTRVLDPQPSSTAVPESTTSATEQATEQATEPGTTQLPVATTVLPDAPILTIPPTDVPFPEVPPTDVLWDIAPRLSTADAVAIEPFEIATDGFATVSVEALSVLEVRSADALLAEVELPCPSSLDCAIRSARIHNNVVWVAVEDTGLDGVTASTRVVSVDASAGQIREHVIFDDGESVDSGVMAAGQGADGVIYVFFTRFDVRRLVTVADGHVQVRAEGVSGFRLSADGSLLAVGYADPVQGLGDTSIEVTDLVDGRTSRFDTFGVNAGPGEWSPDGAYLVVNEQWEDGRSWVVDPWSETGQPLPGTAEPGYEAGGLRETTCFVGNSTVAYRTWDIGYGQGDAQLGTVQFRSVETGEVLDDRGVDLFGQFDLRCHADGSVTYLTQPVVEVELGPEVTQLEPVFDAPGELVHLAADGTATVRAAGNLRFV